MLTFIKYSTARSGLLKLARRARMTCSRGKPISTMFSIDVCSTAPLKKEVPAGTSWEGGGDAIADAGAGAGAGAGADAGAGAGTGAGAGAGAGGADGTGVDADPDADDDGS